MIRRDNLMKLKELIQLRQILGALANQKMSIKSSYSIARFISQTNDAEVIYNQKIQELINEFGDRDEQGNFKQDENGNIYKFKMDEYIKIKREDKVMEIQVKDLQNTDEIYI